MDTTTSISSDNQNISPSQTRHRFFEVYWELKILFWGLALIAIASVAWYAWMIRGL